jgi:hypothetical protein
MPSHIEMCIDPTEKGIQTQGTLDDDDAERTEVVEEDSEMEENLDIMEFEKRSFFDDEDGIEEDE